MDKDLEGSEGKKPTIAIIVVNHNGMQHLERCLSSLRNLNYPIHLYEVIVVDNGSTDGSVELLRKEFPWVKLIALNKNYGFCLPNNIGVLSTKADFVVFLNNDTEVTRDWLLELVEPVLRDSLVVSTVGKLLYMDNPKYVNVAGGKLAITGGYYLGYGCRDGSAFNRPGYTGFGTGAGVLVKRDFFLKVGGFDPVYFASIEEVELGWIIWRSGYRVYYNPKAVMFHKESGTFGKRGIYDPRKLFLLVRNRLLMLVKIMPPITLISALLLSFLFDFVKLISLGGVLRIAILEGWLSFFRLIPYAKRRRSLLKQFFIYGIREIKPFNVVMSLSDILRNFLARSEDIKF